MTVTKADEDFVYCRIGMALMSAQRVEFLTFELVEHLAEFDKDLYNITTDLFLEDSQKSKKSRNQTLGMIFKRLKLNPSLVLEDELDKYLEMRNMLVHGFWKNYLRGKSKEQVEKAINFCNTFGMLSGKVESFFKGLMYSLQLHTSKEINIPIDLETMKWEKDYYYFIEAINKKDSNKI